MSRCYINMSEDTWGYHITWGVIRGGCYIAVELPYSPLGFLLSRTLLLSPQVVFNPLSKFRRQPTKNGVCCAILIGDPHLSYIVITLQKSMICKRYWQIPLSLQEIDHDVQSLFACMMMNVDCRTSLFPCISQCTLPLQGYNRLYNRLYYMLLSCAYLDGEPEDVLWPGMMDWSVGYCILI